MRCPKCGYNSFDHLDSCKKCGKDLVEHKQRFGIVSVLFPGQMQPVDEVAVAEEESVAADAVAAATATAASAAAAAEPAAEPVDLTDAEAAPDSSDEGEGFGFDFMGDSDEEEDLSFDELFEEASADEDVEETLPSPDKGETDDAAENADEFAFDMNDDDEAEEGIDVAPELEDDFGFDPDDDTNDPDAASAEAAEDLDGADFEPQPADEEDFSFETDDVTFAEPDDEAEAAGTEEDPKSPFDLPGSSPHEVAPEQSLDLFVFEEEPESAVAKDDEPLFGVDEDINSFPASVDQDVISVEVPELVEDATLPGVAEPLETTAEVSADIPLEPASEIAEQDQERKTEEFAAFEQSSDATDSGGFAVPEPEEIPDVASVAEAVAAEAQVADLTPEESDLEVVNELLPATGNRIAAFCCDLILLLAVGISFVVAAEAAISTKSDSLLPSFETLIDLSVPYFLVLFSLAFGYFTLFHFLVGQTPGKMLVGLRVETITGDPLLFSHAFLRSVGGLLQMLPAGLGCLIILSSPDRRGWNDRLAGTRLISVKGLAEEA